MGYDNSNRGAMWPSADKASERHPDFKGSLDVDGKKYWVSGWRRKENANPAAPIITFTVEAKQEPREADRRGDRGPTQPTDYSLDDLPF